MVPQAAVARRVRTRAKQTPWCTERRGGVFPPAEQGSRVVASSTETFGLGSSTETFGLGSSTETFGLGSSLLGGVPRGAELSPARAG